MSLTAAQKRAYDGLMLAQRVYLAEESRGGQMIVQQAQNPTNPGQQQATDVLNQAQQEVIAAEKEKQQKTMLLIGVGLVSLYFLFK